MIQIPTTIHGERVVCAFPIIGGPNHGHFVEADIVTTDENGTFTVSRFLPPRTNVDGTVRKEAEVTVGTETRSFPDAIRLARKNAGWG